MSIRGARALLPYLPAVMLAAGIVLSMPWWPDSRLVLAEASLWNPVLLEIVRNAITITLLGGLLATALMRRFLAWPWLFLAALLMVHIRPPVPIVERLLGSSMELVILLGLLTGEHLLRSRTAAMQPRQRQLALVGTAVLLVFLGFGPELLPDNPQWQAGILPLAALLICGNALFAAPLALAGRLALRLRPAVPRLPAIRLPRPRLPQIPIPLRKTRDRRDAPATEVPLRPMLSLDEGYLVRHEKEASRERQRRIG